MPPDLVVPPSLAVRAERSAAPALVQAALDRLAEGHPGLFERLDADPQLAGALVAVIAASRSLTRVLEIRPEGIATLAALDRRAPRADTTPAELVRWKQLELLRIAARDLIGLDPLERTTAALAALAEDVLEGAYLLTATPHEEPTALAVIGMGKLGGRELNYASDIDIIFVGDGPHDPLERRARALVEIAATCFRVDTNLRPQGRDGPLVRSLDSFEAYWGRWAEPWEFQALLKARAVAGDRRLGGSFTDTAARWLWSHPFAVDDLRDLRQMKQRSETEVANRGLAEREIKRGRGGIRDIEFTVQLLQLVHGHNDPDLRSPTTLEVLGELADAGYIDRADATALAEAYRFLRTLEHRLQLEEEQQVHTVPVDPEALDRLARVMGFRDAVAGTATRQLEQLLLSHQLAVRSIHERVYFRPLLEAFAHRGSPLSATAAMTQLQAFGFTDADRTKVAVGELTRGLNRSSRLMQQFLPLILDWLSRTPDPDLGLLLLRNLLTGSPRTAQLIDVFRDSPEAAQRVCTLLGTSRLVGDILIRNPDLVARLPDQERLRTRSKEDLVESALAVCTWRETMDSRQVALRRWKDRNLLGITARDVLDAGEVEAVAADLALLAEASLETALLLLEPKIPFCVIAMGRLGGAELSYASDLDVLFVYDRSEDDDPVGAPTEALRLASGLRRFLGGKTPALKLYDVDADLRPEGRHGPLARTVEGFEHYWDHYALVWERQAMIRARPVAGDLALGQRLLATIEPQVWDAPLTPSDVREIRRSKARVESERIPVHEDPQFHLKLGRGSLSDVEFTVQLLQLRHGIRSPGTMHALRLLAEAGVLDDDDADTLMTSYRFCERTRNRWYLVNSKPGDSLPTAPEQLRWLARSLDMDPTELRERYRRVTRRARRVVERVFYEKE